MKNICSVQELATFLRNAAYADGQKHHLSWSLSVIHPSTNDGSVGYSGGIFQQNTKFDDKFRSLSFTYSETTGLTNVKAWKGANRAVVINEDKMEFADFQSYVVNLFGLEHLYEPK